MGQIAVAQPVSDHAVIPVAVTIQSVLRLNIRSGGTIEFVFNNVDAITNGIPNSPAYDTRFDIAATQNWDLFIGTEDAFLTSDEGVDIPVDHIALYVDGDILANRTSSTNYAAPDVLQLGPIALLELDAALGSSNVGIPSDNEFTIHWSCGDNATTGATAMTGTNPGRYTVNVYLSLQAH
ncbi:MAG: hypothetical protein U0W24_23825 [Bacteroidales bacterium]